MRVWPQRYTLVALTCAAVFICYIDRVNISVAALSMQEEFGWSESVKGLVLASFFLGYLLFQIPSAFLARRYGGKTVLGIAVIWWSVWTLLAPAAAAISLPALIAARVAMGLGEAAMFPAAYHLLANWTVSVERARAVSLINSGIPLGTLFGLAAAAWIIARFDWPMVFYTFGGAGLVWAFIWFTRIHEHPGSHPRISMAERDLLANDGARKSTPEAPAGPIPWARIFSKPAVWALLINHFCNNWTLYMLLAWLPSYFRNVQQLDIASAGIASAAPWLTMLLMFNVGAWIADTMVRRGIGLTATRKTMQLAGLLGSASCLLIARDVTDPLTAQVLMCGALGALALCWSGFATNHLDIAPRHAGVLMGVTNTAGTLPGVIGVAITGWLVDASGTYASAFVLAAAISGVGALVWLAFATGRRVID